MGTDDLPHPVSTHHDPDDERPPISPRRPLLPLRCPDSHRRAIPPRRTESLLRVSSHYARRHRAQGLNAPACLPLPGGSIPAQGPCRLRRGAEAPAGGGLRRGTGTRDPGEERRSLEGRRRATAGDTQRPGHARRPHPGHLRPGRMGRGSAVSDRASATARPRVPSSAPARPALPRFLRTEPGDPSSAGCPRQPPPLPGRLPLVTLSPPPAPPAPHRNGKYLPGWGGGLSHASLKGSLP